MSRECDFCEQNEATLKCKNCFKAYCTKCGDINFIQDIMLGAFTGFISIVFNGFSLPRYCIHCQNSKLKKF